MKIKLLRAKAMARLVAGDRAATEAPAGGAGLYETSTANGGPASAEYGARAQDTSIFSAGASWHF